MRKCKRWSQQLVDQELIGRNIERAEDFTGIAVRMNWRCLICSHVWKTSPTHILNDKSGCPKCSHHIKLTKEEVNKLLEGRFILLGEYITCDTKSLFLCLSCLHEWECQPYHLIKKEQQGCPRCAGRYKMSKGEQIIYDLLKSLNIEFEHHQMLKLNGETYYIDFILENQKIVIEYNGAQHYKPIKYWADGCLIKAEEQLLRQQLRDGIIEDYYVSQGYIFVEVPYKLTEQKIINKIKGILCQTTSEIT